MDSHRKNSADDMLQQLRQRYAEGTPEDIFNDAGQSDDEDTAFDEEISEKFNRLFSGSDADVKKKRQSAKPLKKRKKQVEAVAVQHTEEALPIEESEDVSPVMEDLTLFESQDPMPEEPILTTVQGEEPHADKELIPVREQTSAQEVTDIVQNEAEATPNDETAERVTSVESEQIEPPAETVQLDVTASDGQEAALAEPLREQQGSVSPLPTGTQVAPAVLTAAAPTTHSASIVERESVVSTVAPTPPPPVAPPAKPRPSPLDAALLAQRQKEQEKQRDTTLNTERVLSDEDVALLLKLGYATELNKKLDSGRIEQVRQPVEKEIDSQRAHTMCAYDGKEYTESGQTEQIALAYRKATVANGWRVALTAVFALLTLLVDLSPLYAAYLPAPIAAVAVDPVAHLLGLQMLVFCAAPSLRRLWYGLVSFVRSSFEPVSVVLPVLLVTTVYDVIMAIQATRAISLNFPTALLLLLLTVSDLMDVRRERMTFAVVSSERSKVLLSALEPRKKKVVREGRIVKILNDDIDRRIYAVVRTEHVTGYFRRTAEQTSRYRCIPVFLTAQLLISLLIAALSLLRVEAAVDVLTVFLLTMQLTLPAALLISFSYPMLLGARRLSAKGAAIVGSGTVDTMAGEQTLVFDDTEMLQARSATEITVRGSGDPRKYIRYARRIFRTVGGTLSKITTSDLSEEVIEGGVDILRIAGEGFEALIDGKVRALVGTSAFMVKNGVRVPNTGAELLAKKNEESSILYLAFGGQLRLGYEINYRIHGNFEGIVSLLGKGGVAVALRTYDPTLTDAYLATGRAHRTYPVTVRKPVRFEPPRIRKQADGGVVATGNARNIAYAVRMCGLLQLNERQLMLVRSIMLPISAAAAAFLALSGYYDQTITLIVAVLQMVFCLPVFMLSRKNLWTEDTPDTASAKPKRKTKK